jgi:bifunctional DNase/RNase
MALKISILVDEIILGVTHSTYQLVLKEEHGKRRIPIVIGVSEAQSIALALEGKLLKRPNTHDLFTTALQKYDINIDEVYIHRLEEGVFFSTITMSSDHHGMVFLDSRTSDAVAMAIRFDAPLYIEDQILQTAGINEDFDYSEEPGRGQSDLLPPEPQSFQEELELISTEELEQMLQMAISEEDYHKAALIRDEITRRS